MKWILITIVGITIGYWLGKRRMHRIVNQAQIEKHKQNLTSVIALANQHGEITNDLVEKTLGVSNATAGRYLQELETEGKLTQIGTTGKYVIYRAN